MKKGHFGCLNLCSLTPRFLIVSGITNSFLRTVDPMGAPRARRLTSRRAQSSMASQLTQRSGRTADAPQTLLLCNRYTMHISLTIVKITGPSPLHTQAIVCYHCAAHRMTRSTIIHELLCDTRIAMISFARAKPKV